ncbi:MAG: class I SAM-dependent methyltransferase [Planctomycetota bacterium]
MSERARLEELKQVDVTGAVLDYCLGATATWDTDVLRALREETAALGDVAVMQIPPLQDSLLTMLVASIRARVAVEVGTFTGASAISIARGLVLSGVEDPRLFCHDVSNEWTAIARRYWERAGLSGVIELSIGPALETLPRTVESLGSLRIDFVFIDADKVNSRAYIEALYGAMRPGGIIVVDNALRDGRVLPGGAQTDSDRASAALNRDLAQDERFETLLLPLADGLLICRVC